MTDPLRDTSRLCLHTITTRPLPLETALEKYAQAGVRGVTLWRQALEGRNLAAVRRQVQAAGLRTVSLCRAGFFASTDPRQREAAIAENRRVINQAAELEAPLVVLVCGADPAQPLSKSRQQIESALERLLPQAEACGVRLGIEPLHPMYAGDRSAINTLEQANDLTERLDSSYAGVVVDVYHLWWDPHLQAEIERCGQGGRLFAFHVCDWKLPLEDTLNDRGLMGEGCIPLRQIRGWVEDSGFDGFIEVEIFSNRYWATDQSAFIQAIRTAFLQHC